MPTTTSTRASLAHRILAAGALALLLPATAVPAAPADWLAGKTVRGNGLVKQETRTPGHFDAVELSLAGNLELRLGDSESVTILADENVLPLIETVLENGSLKIRTNARNGNIALSRLKIVVQARNIERLVVGGSGSIEAASLRAPRLQIDIGGSGSVTVGNVACDALAVSIGGSGNFKGAGHAATLSVAIDGSGSVQAGQLSANDVHVNSAGSGQAVVWARRTLSVSLAGSGGVDYYGDPQVSTSAHGSGGVRRIGAAPR